MDMNLCELWKMEKDREAQQGCSPCDHKESDTTLVPEQQQPQVGPPALCSYSGSSLNCWLIAQEPTIRTESCLLTYQTPKNTSALGWSRALNNRKERRKEGQREGQGRKG